jgi:effector-binding domain-containing protein
VKVRWTWLGGTLVVLGILEAMTNDDARPDYEIVSIDPQPTVTVRITEPMAELDLAAAYDRSIPLVAARIAEAGGQVAGAPFGRYHRFNAAAVDIEIGFPVVAPPAGIAPLDAVGPGEAGMSSLPGGSVARTIHRGSYDGLKAAFDALHEWIHAQPGVDDGDGPWESYLDSPAEVAMEDVRTEIVWPLVTE